VADQQISGDIGPVGPGGNSMNRQSREMNIVWCMKKELHDIRLSLFCLFSPLCLCDTL
jgi:hypothetical protein